MHFGRAKREREVKDAGGKTAGRLLLNTYTIHMLNKMNQVGNTNT
jgi:hypothetical protein